MNCECEKYDGKDGFVVLTCRHCGESYEFAKEQEPKNFLVVCGTAKLSKPVSELTYADLHERILNYLQKFNSADAAELQNDIGCNRVPGVLQGMVARGFLTIDTPAIEKNTLFAIAPEEPVDVVYPLGNGSRWGDNELRYSLRSLVKYFPQLGRVFVVGQKPAWLQNVIHIPFPDTYKNNKDANLIAKVLAACDAGISKRFLRISDDEMFLQPVQFAKMTPIHYGELKDKPNSYFSGKWKGHLKNTRDRMAETGHSTLHYDIHSPNAYDRETFKKVMAEHPWATLPMTINTLYYNGSDAPGRKARSEKVTCESAIHDIKAIQEKIKGKRYFNVNDKGLTDAMKKVIQELYPDPSPFEAEVTTKRGIVTLAGGPVYFTNAYINCRMLRHLGCQLPIEWCYLGAEMSPTWLELIQRTIPNVRLVDLGGKRKDNSKGKGGWQAKVDAVLQSEFDELLFLDADSFPLRDPSDLFAHRLFQKHDCILWPDIHVYDENFQALIKEKYGVTVKGRQIESGQMLFRKSACMPGLLKTREINRNSRESYKHLFGDKDTFLIGARQGGVNCIVNPHVVRRCSQRNLVQHDLDGRRLFIHLTAGKWRPNQRAAIDVVDYPHLATAGKIFLELQNSNVAFEMPKMEINMRVRDTTGAVEAANIIQNDSYEIRPMIGSGRVKYIVDVGGNAGAFTFMASLCYPESEIICIEPDPELMEDIRYNTRECRAKIHYVEAACIGDERELVPYVRVAANRGGSYVRVGDWEQQREEVVRPEDKEIPVPATTLPKLLEQYGFQSIDILKIDAEGVEGAVLLSLKESGWMPKVHWIRGEWHGKEDWPRIRAALQDTHEFRLCDGTALGYMIAHARSDA
jgi:FkbM family methyltransferase